MDEYVPTFTPAVRTRVYVGALIVDVLAFVVCGILAVLEIVDAVQVLAIGGIVATGTGLVTKGMAVAYRPTRPDIRADGRPLVTVLDDDTAA